MTYEVGLAETAEEKEAVYRFRYSVYVEEMGRYQGSADHAGRRLVEPDDEQSFVFYVRGDDGVVGTARLSWGGFGFSERQIEEYSLAPFLAELPHEHIAVGERVMVTPELRGTGLVEELMDRRDRTSREHDVRIQFSACEPHLLSLYLGQGRRTYAAHEHQHQGSGLPHPVGRVPGGPGGVDRGGYRHRRRGAARQRGADLLRVGAARC